MSEAAAQPPEDDTAKQIEQVMAMFPNVQPQWIRQQLQFGGGMDIAMLTDIILADENVPKKEKRRNNAPTAIVQPADTKIAQTDLGEIINAHTKITEEARIQFEESAVKRLSAEFSRVSMVSLRNVFRQARYHYSVAWAMLQLVARAQTPPIDLGRPSSMHTGHYQAAISWAEEVIDVQFTVTKSKRGPGAARGGLPPSAALIEEMQIVAKAIEEGRRMNTAGASNPTDDDSSSDDDDSDQFECQTLEKVLDVGLRNRLNEQSREQNLCAANLDNFERCRYCNWGVCIDVPKEKDKVFHCQNPLCMADICRLCGNDWDDDHIGKRCDKMLRNIQDKARKEYEEKMSEAVIRKCPNCKTPFDKVEGCNRMACRCGHTMCYLCRQPKINYKHFCPHPKEPNETGCPSKCGRCMLWEVAAQARRQGAGRDTESGKKRRTPSCRRGCR